MAENQDGQEKSEQATAKRLEEARLRGQVSKSVDVTTAIVLLFGGMTVFLFGVPLIDNFKLLMTEIFSVSHMVELNDTNITHYYFELITHLAKMLLPILVSIFFIVLAAEISQVGLKLATKKFTEGGLLKTVTNPFKGLKRIFFSTRSLFELVKSLFKVVVLGGVVYWILASRVEETIGLMDMPYFEIGNFMATVAFEILLKVAAVYIVIALADYIYQKQRFKKDMKMTKQEVKEELKQQEGDPKVKAHLRQLIRSRIRKLMMQNVEQADVVITNPTHFSVAVKYDPANMNAPVVVAKGLDFIAIEIRKKARENDIPIVEQPPLARVLYYTVDVDEPIPENLFKTVAQVLAYVYQIKGKAAEKVGIEIN